MGFPRPADAAPQVVVIPRAARVDLSHTGIHTHANFVRFDTGKLDVAAMLKDPVRFPRLTVRGGCRLPTDHAALPPEWASPGDPPLENPYGPMPGSAGKPGWSTTAGSTSGRNWVQVSVPTRFANWVALQPKPKQRQYQDGRNYRLEVRWEGDGAGAVESPRKETPPKANS